jgi:hypothetical protein
LVLLAEKRVFKTHFWWAMEAILNLAYT